MRTHQGVVTVLIWQWQLLFEAFDNRSEWSRVFSSRELRLEVGDEFRRILNFQQILLLPYNGY